ncbi:hypothetical protein TNIN_132911 [Trichonephila inaurata madagascariensis]|uniref:Uncharacterized protein n=1 Tax=Trichonephila inaurata madagascariensis TaxID=2747483 RepID=A0A8X7C0L8_9ARAC|nr:hypothetical protein TNIN_132911 [Trichonephila inaurata madagascariensis]
MFCRYLTTGLLNGYIMAYLNQSFWNGYVISKTGKKQLECNFEQLMKARMKITCKPSKDCIDQVQQFLNGDLNASTVDGSPTSEEKST